MLLLLNFVLQVILYIRRKLKRADSHIHISYPIYKLNVTVLYTYMLNPRSKLNLAVIEYFFIS